MSNEACEWCAQTSGQIDSIEYENETLKKQVESFGGVDAIIRGQRRIRALHTERSLVGCGRLFGPL